MTECCVCRRYYGAHSPVDKMHHIRTLAAGTKVRAKAPKIPLCEAHHTGIYGIHTLGRKTWELMYGLETSYLEDANDLQKS